MTGAFLFLATACTTFLSATKNGLFLDVYPSELIPHAVIAAALTTAVAAVIFAGVLGGSARRGLAVWLTGALVVALLGCRIAFEFNPRAAFGVYLVISAAQVLVMSHAWDYVSDLLTGRQAKRMLPAIGIGASFGAIVGGAAVAPAAIRFGTADLLFVAAGLIAVALPLLWAVPEPAPEESDEPADTGAVRSFLVGASKGFRWLGREPLLRLLALGAIALTLTSTLIDLQLKFALQAFDRDQITAIYGLMSIAIGTGTLAMQVWASRVILPRLGVSFAALLQGGVIAIGSGAAAVMAGVWALVGLRALDDTLEFSLQNPVEKISLLPFPRGAKSAAVTTLDGVLAPLTEAGAGFLALALVTRPELLPPLTVVAGVASFAIYTRHRRHYMAALESALTRHSVDFESTPLIVGREALDLIDRALEDEDPTVIVFAASLLEQLPTGDAAPRVARLLQHGIPEVRAEVALALSRIDHADDDFAGVAVTERLRVEDAPIAISSLLGAAGVVPGVPLNVVLSFADHPDPMVRRAVLVAEARMGIDVSGRLSTLLQSEEWEAKAVAAGAIGELKLTELLQEVAEVIDDSRVRPTVLDAMVSLGEVAVPVMAGLLERRDLPLPARRSVVTALASIPGEPARDALLRLTDEPALGPAALTSLLRMRLGGQIQPVDPALLTVALRREIRQGLKFALAARALRSSPDRSTPRSEFVAAELVSLRDRSIHRVTRILSLSYDPGRLGMVADALGEDDASLRSNALELLEGTISGDTSALVVPFVEACVDDFATGRVADLLPNSRDWLRAPGEQLALEPDWWPQALALHALGRDSEITTPGRSKDDGEEEISMIPLIEKVMILKGSQLFRNFPGGDLAGIASLGRVVLLEKDEVLFEQGDEGDAFYMVVRGAVRISRGSHELAILGPREGFGEMAILDRETRSATAAASEPSTLLRIDRDSFDQLIEQNPAVARGIYRVLNERLRNTLAQVAAG